VAEAGDVPSEVTVSVAAEAAAVSAEASGAGSAVASEEAAEAEPIIPRAEAAEDLAVADSAEAVADVEDPAAATSRCRFLGIVPTCVQGDQIRHKSRR
jgi:hypothetical protein